MSEKLGSSFEEFGENKTSDVSALEEMAGQFDRQKAEEEKRKESEKILSQGEVSKLTEDENGKAKLESEYMDAWSRYKESENYDENDKELNHAIWDVGRGAALLDANQDVAERLKNGDGLFDLMEQDPRVLGVFDKAFEDMSKIANSKNEAAANATMEYIKNTGKVGEILVEEYADWVEAKDISREKAEGEQEEPLEEFNRLEQKFAELYSGKTIESEDVDSLMSEYKALSKSISDPKTLETIKDRYENLASLSERLESVNHLSNS